MQSQSYGPESRGGSSKADVIISDEDIDYPEVKRPDVLLVMAQELATVCSRRRSAGLVIIDSEHVKNVPEVKAKVLKYAISQRARELGRDSCQHSRSGALVGITR